MENNEKASTTSSETAEQTRTLDVALADLMTEFRYDQGKIYRKRCQLFALLREIGAERFREAIQRTIESYKESYFPPMAYIRDQVTSIRDLPPAEREAKDRRHAALKEKSEFQGLVYEINYLNERAEKYPDDAARCRFRRRRIVSLLHAWLKQHPAYVAKLPDDLTWITDERAMREYAAENSVAVKG